MSEFRHILEDIYLLETPAGGVWSGIILVDGDEKILIDSGSRGSDIDDLLVPALEKRGETLSDIDWLLNTHCHGDHVGGHKRILELCSPKVAVYRKSVDKIHNPLKYSKLIRATFPGHSPTPPAVLEGVKESLVLDDGDVVAGRVKLIATPGHDDDCVCLYDMKTKTLITGDSLQGNGTATQGTALYISVSDYMNSLRRLKDMDIENIISGHPYLISGSQAMGKAESIAYLDTCMEIVGKYGQFVEQQLGETGDDQEAHGQASCRRAEHADLEQICQDENAIAELAQKLIAYMGNTKPDYLFLPMYTVKAHIEDMLTKN